MKGEIQTQLDNQPEQLPPPSDVVVQPWVDEQVEQHGFGPRSMYVETLWLPVLGPTSTWLYRRLGTWAEFNPKGLSVNIPELAESLGLGQATGRQSLVWRAIDRLVRFQAMRWDDEQLMVRRALAPLPHHYVNRLNERHRRLHDEYVRQLGQRAISANGERRLVT